MPYLLKQGNVRISMLILVLMAASTILPAHSAANGSDLPEPGKSSEWLTEKTESTIVWYFNDAVDLRFSTEHVAARERHLPPQELVELDNGSPKLYWDFARKGHLMKEGRGTILGYYKIENTKGPMFFKFYSFEQLTIFFPTGNIVYDKPLDTLSQGDVIVFWSAWGHEKYHCFAYASRGRINLHRLPVPPELMNLAPDIIPAGDEPRFQTVEANLELKFDEIVDEEQIASQGKRKSCHPPEISGYRQFYWRPIQELNWSE
jgi:hypothetical protein